LLSNQGHSCQLRCHDIKSHGVLASGTAGSALDQTIRKIGVCFCVGARCAADLIRAFDQITYQSVGLF
jgi:hypothetical protein